ncbi:MAG: MFS transporter [Steroidobacteraceae bacterium]
MFQLEPAYRRARTLPRGVWALGAVSLCMDVSSELIHSLLPVYLTVTLGASLVSVGLIEGAAESVAALVRVFSGALSDRLRRRKAVALAGYALAALSKPIFPLATTVGTVFAARFIDRIGKGIRGAPRDALVADLTPAHLRGAAFGLRQSLDSVGAFLGPLFAIALMVWLAGEFRSVLWLATLPAWIAVGVLLFAVHEPRATSQRAATGAPVSGAAMLRLPAKFWRVAALGGVFTLARFSEAFLVLRVQGLGIALAYVPAVLVVMNLAYAGFAWLAGAWADRMRPSTLLAAGLGVLVIADMVLAAASATWVALLGAALWGLHMAMTQGLFAKLIADHAPADLRGTAFGVFNFIGAAAVLLASAIAGALWAKFGAPAAFVAGGSFALLAMTGLLMVRGRNHDDG